MRILMMIPSDDDEEEEDEVMTNVRDGWGGVFVCAHVYVYVYVRAREGVSVVDPILSHSWMMHIFTFCSALYA